MYIDIYQNLEMLTVRNVEILWEIIAKLLNKYSKRTYPYHTVDHQFDNEYSMKYFLFDWWLKNFLSKQLTPHILMYDYVLHFYLLQLR